MVTASGYGGKVKASGMESLVFFLIVVALFGTILYLIYKAIIKIPASISKSVSEALPTLPNIEGLSEELINIKESVTLNPAETYERYTQTPEETAVLNTGLYREMPLFGLPVEVGLDISESMAPETKAGIAAGVPYEIPIIGVPVKIGTTIYDWFRG